MFGGGSGGDGVRKRPNSVCIHVDDLKALFRYVQDDTKIFALFLFKFIEKYSKINSNLAKYVNFVELS